MTVPEFKAYGNRVFVEMEQAANTTAGGVLLPDGTRIEKYAKATVISVGPGVMTQFGWDAPRVEIGDRITFEVTRSQLIDPDNHIAALWPGDILGVEADEELPRYEGRLLLESA